MKCLIGFAVLAVAFQLCSAKTFTVCELAQALKNQGFSNADIPTWICIAQAESGLSTSQVDTDADGVGYYGLFGINNHDYCSNTGTPGQLCNVNCSDLVTDDISKTAACALTIYNSVDPSYGQGFSAWTSYNTRCWASNQLPDTSSC